MVARPILGSNVRKKLLAERNWAGQQGEAHPE
jgi:hypothetical protein